MNQRTQNAITIAVEHTDGDLVEVELAFRHAEMGQHKWITHSHKMIQTQWNYKNLSLASCQAKLLQNLISKSDDAPHKTHTRHGVASLGLPQGLTPKMLESDLGWREWLFL